MQCGCPIYCGVEGIFHTWEASRHLQFHAAPVADSAAGVGLLRNQLPVSAGYWESGVGAGTGSCQHNGCLMVYCKSLQPRQMGQLPKSCPEPARRPAVPGQVLLSILRPGSCRMPVCISNQESVLRGNRGAKHGQALGVILGQKVQSRNLR